MSADLGQTVKKSDIDGDFLSSPGEDLVPKLLMQLASVPGMVKLFGPYTPLPDGNGAKSAQRWADYERKDWSMRQLPAINVFEALIENKTSDNAWLNGTVQIQIFWPASFRRSDFTRVPAAMKGVLQNFFASKYVTDMLDELYSAIRPMKVNALNELGKTIDWTPNAEGLVGSELVPVTVMNANYRIDLRAWYRTLEFQGRTKEDPFEDTLLDLSIIAGDFNGVTTDNATPVSVTVSDEIDVSNPTPGG